MARIATGLCSHAADAAVGRSGARAASRLAGTRVEGLVTRRDWGGRSLTGALQPIAAQAMAQRPTAQA